MTMNDTWGYAKNDQNWKSTADLVRKLCDIAHKGGNFLLNVGPTAEGEIPVPSVERLTQVGRWMKANGASIYGAGKSPWKRLSFEGCCTVKGHKLYLLVFNWPSDTLQLAGLRTEVKRARVLGGGERLAHTRTVPRPAAEGVAGSEPPVLVVAKPKRLDPMVTVVELTLSGPPEVVDVSPVQQPDSEGRLTLKAVDAEIHGENAQYEQGGGKDNIGFWTRREDWVSWTCKVARAGRYRVEVTYACPPDNEGSEYTVGLDSGAKVRGTVKATGSWSAFQSEPLGELELPAGRATIVVRPVSMPRGAVMNLQQVKLTPVK
jgi:alpha-L-fucosidase